MKMSSVFTALTMQRTAALFMRFISSIWYEREGQVNVPKAMNVLATGALVDGTKSSAMAKTKSMFKFLAYHSTVSLASLQR
jgi:hypothetical protein